MTQNIIFKTGECALSHLIELRLYYVKMSWIRNFMNNHNPSTMGQIQNLIYEEAKKRNSLKMNSMICYSLLTRYVNVLKKKQNVKLITSCELMKYMKLF